MLPLSKELFLATGIETITASRLNATCDCTICLSPLLMVPPSSSKIIHPDNLPSTSHEAVRIKSCGHIHGRICLTAWLETGYTCPLATCKWTLFVPADKPDLPTDQNIHRVIEELGEEFGEARVTLAVMRCVQELEEREVVRRQKADTAIAFQQIKVEQRERDEGKEFGMVWEDSGEEGGWESDGDMEEGEDESLERSDENLQTGFLD